MTDEEITAAILSVDENDELSKDMVEQVSRNCVEICRSKISYYFLRRILDQDHNTVKTWLVSTTTRQISSPMRSCFSYYFPQYCGELGGHIGESACLPPVWPGFDSSPALYVGWVCCWSSPCSEGFSPNKPQHLDQDREPASKASWGWCGLLSKYCNLFIVSCWKCVQHVFFGLFVTYSFWSMSLHQMRRIFWTHTTKRLSSSLEQTDFYTTCQG